MSSSSAASTLTNLVSADNVAASSVSSVSSKASSLTSSVSSVLSSNSSASSSSSNVAAGLMAHPISWKFGAAIMALMAGSFALGAGI